MTMRFLKQCLLSKLLYCEHCQIHLFKGDWNASFFNGDQLVHLGEFNTNIKISRNHNNR